MNSSLFPVWESLCVHPLICSVLTECGFPGASPVQQETIKLFSQSTDVIVEAMTGSGKTLAYLIPILEEVIHSAPMDGMNETNMESKTVAMPLLALIILPSRELARQVHQLLSHLLAKLDEASSSSLPREQPSYGKCVSLCTVGGRPIQQDLSKMARLTKSCNVLVGTPGRLHELLVEHTRHVVLSPHFRFVVLDEADKLLEFGHSHSIQTILQTLPKERRTGLFSATQTRDMTELARARLTPSRVSRIAVRTEMMNESSPTASQGVMTKPEMPSGLDNRYLIVSHAHRLDALLAAIIASSEKRMIIFVNACATVNWLSRALTCLLPNQMDPNNSVLPVLALHGRLFMSTRLAVHRHPLLTNTTNPPSLPFILVSTDLAARGLDLIAVSDVIHFDPPTEPKTFLHRSGRTARMGAVGRSLILLTESEKDFINFLSLQKVKLKRFKPFLEVCHCNGGGRDICLSPSVNTLRQRMTKEQETTSSSSTQTDPNSPLSPPPPLLAWALRAFVSTLRAYKEHECSFLFPLSKLNPVSLATGFGLFTIPRCGDLKQWRGTNIPLPTTLRRQQVAHKDKAKAMMRKPKTKFKQSDRNKRRESLKRIKSNGERQRAFRREEENDLRREAHWVKLERKGRMKSSRVDEWMGMDGIENALEKSTRARKTKRRW